MQGVGDYAFRREIGRGAHGRVYVASAPRRLGLDEAEVAVKVLADRADDATFDAVLRELYFVDGLRSDRIVRVYDVGLAAGVLFWAMALHRMGSLAAPRQHLSRRGRLKAVARAARAAHVLHEAGLVHGAISPPNVLLHTAGAVLAEPAVWHLVSPEQTLAGTGRGGDPADVQLVDPSVVRGAPAGRASDIWSLGVTLHLALTGAGLYPALVSADPMDAVRTFLRSSPTPDRTLSEAERSVVVRALQPDPADRYPTAAAFADDVEALR